MATDARSEQLGAVYAPASVTPNYLNRAQAAEYLTARFGLPMSVRRLAVLRHQGTGPRMHKGGKFALYSPADLDRYAEDLIRPVGGGDDVDA